MTKTGWVVIGAVVLIAVYVLCINLWTMGVTKEEIKKANVYAAQFNVVETQIDNTVSTIVNTYKVPDKFAKDFIAVALAQSSGRKGGVLFKSNTEAANKLGITDTLYAKIMNTTEGKLNELKSSQDVLTSMWKEHKNWCEDPFHNNPFFALGMGPSLIGKVKQKPEMITSELTKKAVKTKKLDTMNLIPDIEK